jgi:hypothetical protein
MKRKKKRKTYSKSFGIHAILDQRDAVAERLPVEIGVLLHRQFCRSWLCQLHSFAYE